MYYFLIVLLILVAILLAVVVLLQAGQGGGLASLGGGGGTDLVVGGRQAVTILTKGTWVLGGIFLFLALVISLVSPSQSGEGSEVLQKIRQGQAPPTAPANLPIEALPQDSGSAAAQDSAVRPSP